AEGMKLGKGVTSMTRDGYRQDNRGGIFAGVERLYCGRSAAGERLRVIQQVELGQATGGRDALMREREQTDRVGSALSARLPRPRELGEWREKEEPLAFKRARKEELIRIRREMTEKILENDAKIGQLEQARSDRAMKRGELTARRERLEQ